MNTRSTTAAVLAGLFVPAAWAAEPFKAYENFNSPVINPAKWPGQAERVREIVGKKLRLMARDYGSDASDAGTVGTSWSHVMSHDTSLNAIRATVTVNRVEAEACPGNTAPTEVRARIYGAFFNVATPNITSVNDVTAQVRVIRRSNSTDPAGVLRIEGVVNLCHDENCLSATTLGQASLGTVRLGSPVQLQLVWEKSRNRFLFSRDGGRAKVVRYTQPDASPAGNPIPLLGLRQVVANCTADRRPRGMVDASFDNVYLNRSAAP